MIVRGAKGNNFAARFAAPWRTLRLAIQQSPTLFAEYRRALDVGPPLEEKLPDRARGSPDAVVRIL